MPNNLKPLLAQLKANVLAKRLGYDGGPGSGNWGHKGRPGLVGGSSRSGTAPNGQGGASGGKQYRGGRSDIGYFNSRKDWLNGLSGEKQSEATRLLKSAKSQIPTTSDKTPEEHIMQDWPIEWKEHFMNLVGEARSWRDRGFKLQTENLEPEERMYLDYIGEALDNKYADPGETIFSDEEMLNSNFDEKYGLMSDEEKEFYLDMKAKACGLPTSGKKPSDYSKPFQLEIGYLDKAEPPKTREENEKWLKFLTGEERDDIHKQIGDAFGISEYKISNDPNMDDIEREMADKTLSESKANNGEEYISALSGYLSKKDKYVNAEYFKNLANVSEGGIDNGIGRANYFAAKANKDILKLMAQGDEENFTIENDGEALEAKLLSDKDVPQDVKAAYLFTKAQALGMSPILERRGAHVDVSSYVLGEKQRKEREEREEKKAKTLSDYNSTKKNNNVVIQGDSFSEDINSMRNESGSYTHDEIKKIGSRVSTELEKAAKKNQKEIEKIDEKIKKIDEQRDEEKRKLRENPDGYTLSDVFALEEKYSKLRQPLREQKQEIENRKPIVDLLKRVRQVGPSDPKDMKSHLPGRSTVKKYVQDAYNDYPRDWVDRSLKWGSVSTRKTGRGYYSWSGEIAISGYGKSAESTASHELGHRFEQVIPGIADAEKELFDKRTEGEKEESLRAITGNKGYRSNEKTKKDKFINPYIGKVYNDNTYEIVSMGFQYAIHEPTKLLQDKEYAHFILGLLAVG